MQTMQHSRNNGNVASYQKELAELEKTKSKTGKVTDESVNSTRRMLELVNECQDAGIHTLRMLHDQGESLNRTENGLEVVDQHLQDGDTTLKNIEILEKVPCFLLPCYLCYRSSKKKRDAKRDEKNRKKAALGESSREMNKESIQFKNIGEGGDSNGNLPSTSTSYFKSGSTIDDKTAPSSKTGTSLEQKSHKRRDRYFERITGGKEEDEIESNLEEVSSYISSLKSQAVVMGDTVTGQNSQIDRMNEKAEIHHSKISNLNKRTNRLINSDYSGDSDPIPSPLSISGVSGAALKSGVCPCPCPCPLF